MNLTLLNISKQYKKEWIFKNVSFELATGERCVILGANGSGKSTLLKLISGAMLPSEGNINYSEDSTILTSGSEKIFEFIAIAAPYMELIEDYTLAEHIHFHFHFKKKFNSIELVQIPEIIGLKDATDKQLKYFSSGMKQRVRLGLAILSNTPILLLDEPCSNLDQKAIDWYNGLIREYSKDRTIIVCSNHQQYEYGFCTREFVIDHFKQF